MSSLTRRLRRSDPTQSRPDSPESQSPPAPETSPNPTADRLVQVLLNMKYELTDDQQRHPLFFALDKLEKRMTKDMREIPEAKLREGMSKIGRAILTACEDTPTTYTTTDPTFHLVIPATDGEAASA